jgi:hypothetical protein
MNTKLVRMLQFIGTALLGGIVGFFAPRVLERVAGEGHANVNALKRYRIDAEPHLVAELLRTEPDGLLLTITAADGSQVGVSCDAKRIVEIYRTYSDEANEYMLLDKNADGVPEIKSIKDKKVRASTIERLKNLEWERKP